MGIYHDIVKGKNKLIGTELIRLLDLAWDNQGHIGDLLLFHVNGFFNEELVPFNEHSTKKLNPHVVGPGKEGHSEHAHYKFIHLYKTTNTAKITYQEYLELVKWDPKRKKEIDKLVEFEELSIQIEMLVYLKFWEADMIIKKLYQFVRILHGEPYDWYFKIAESARDPEATGTRQDILRNHIRDKIQSISPILYDVLKSTYKTQIRNSIAHSKYSFHGRNIHLNNYIEEDPASQLRGMTFDEWIDIFHNTICLQNEYIRINNLINEAYGKMAIENDNIIPIQINEKDGRQYELPLEYRPEFKDWSYYNEK